MPKSGNQVAHDSINQDDGFPSCPITNDLAAFDSESNKSRVIGFDNSREISKINKFYDVMYTDKHTTFNLEDCMSEANPYQIVSFLRD